MESKRQKLVVEPSATVLVVLVGLPGSGKSTLCSKLVESAPAATVLSQDLLGKAKCEKQCRELLLSSLEEPRVIVVDRTNLSPKQRATWLDMVAKHCPSAKVLGVEFTLDQATCVERAKSREDHPTLSPNKVAMVVKRLQAQYEAVDQQSEAFDHLLSGSDSSELCESILDYLRAN
ncbi:hypothetical protein BASA81_004824 [Batrachochytrium salamandrivorans]|nr:hypothetical protein BASA81_004824 [Batrachochytrium salamandrivorans]